VLGGDPCWVCVALVVEGARLALLVRPDRRAVERLHGATVVPGRFRLDGRPYYRIISIKAVEMIENKEVE
jgi:hypothetical protein